MNANSIKKIAVGIFYGAAINMYTAGVYAQAADPIQPDNEGGAVEMISAEGENPPGSFSGGPIEDKIKQMLNLTDAQHQKIKTIMSDYQTKVQRFQIQIQRVELDIKEALLADKPDTKKIKGSIDQKMKILGDLEMESILKDLEIKKDLTPEQWTMFSRLLEGMKRKPGAPHMQGQMGPQQNQRQKSQHKENRK